MRGNDFRLLKATMSASIVMVPVLAAVAACLTWGSHPYLAKIMTAVSVCSVGALADLVWDIPWRHVFGTIISIAAVSLFVYMVLVILGGLFPGRW